jgi:hypothetical protein
MTWRGHEVERHDVERPGIPASQDGLSPLKPILFPRAKSMGFASLNPSYGSVVVESGVPYPRARACRPLKVRRLGSRMPER